MNEWQWSSCDYSFIRRKCSNTFCPYQWILFHFNDFLKAACRRIKGTCSNWLIVSDSFCPYAKLGGAIKWLFLATQCEPRRYREMSDNSFFGLVKKFLFSVFLHLVKTKSGTRHSLSNKLCFATQQSNY